MITFDEFKNGQFDPNDPMNEGLFDKLSGMFSKITGLFKDPAKMEKSVESTMDQLGDKTKKFSPKQAKASESYIVQMGDAKKPETKYTMSLTKLADLPDGSGLFQITGTTSKEMLKSLAGSEKIEDLAKNNVMAMISSAGFEKGKMATMRLVKNVIPGGKDYVTKVPVLGIVPGKDVEMNAAKIKK
jgi:hypothetical protein